MANETIIIKSDYVLQGLLEGKYPKILTEMAFVVIKHLRYFGVTPTITSSKRTDGVHSLFRALDFRTWDLTEDQINNILEDLNEMFIYDPERPEFLVIIFHDTGRGPHLHLQCHNNTKRRD